jgi:hypothetical protein
MAPGTFCISESNRLSASKAGRDPGDRIITGEDELSPGPRILPATDLSHALLDHRTADGAGNHPLP